MVANTMQRLRNPKTYKSVYIMADYSLLPKLLHTGWRACSHGASVESIMSCLAMEAPPNNNIVKLY